jgi:hypothetical protein
MYALFSLFLLFWFFSYIDFLSQNRYIVEEYKDIGTPDTSHTVNIPLTTRLSCQNFCGPTSRCSITGQQCFTDVDCPGCQPKMTNHQQIQETKEIRGNNNAGNRTHAYSILTTDIGTQAKLYSSNKKLQPAMPNFGINTWIQGYTNTMTEFTKRYTPSGLQFMPKYEKRVTMTGQFVDDGPLPSNAWL